MAGKEGITCTGDEYYMVTVVVIVLEDGVDGAMGRWCNGAMVGGHGMEP